MMVVVVVTAVAVAVLVMTRPSILKHTQLQLIRLISSNTPPLLRWRPKGYQTLEILVPLIEWVVAMVVGDAERVVAESTLVPSLYPTLIHSEMAFFLPIAVDVKHFLDYNK